jgi:hypothetical protein
VWSRLVVQRLASAPHPWLQPVWSEWIIAETWRVLTWRWLTARGPIDEVVLTQSANRMLRRLLQVMRCVSLYGIVGAAPWPGLRDAEDAPIWATAVAAGAQYVISHNTTDFPPLVGGRHVYRGIEYLTAIEFIEDVLGLDVEELYGRPLRTGASVRSQRVRQARRG